jgi:hypothetical protein
MDLGTYRPAARIFFDPTIERLGHELVTKADPHYWHGFSIGVAKKILEGRDP